MATKLPSNTQEALKPYSVEALATIYVYTEVQASSPGQALQIAKNLPVQDICNVCSNKKPANQWVFDGYSHGMPDQMKVVE